MNIYNRIERLLSDNNMSRKDLSNQINVSYNTLTSLFQRQSKNINLDTIKKIASALHVSIDFLISGEDIRILTLEEDSDEFLNNASFLENEINKVAKELSIKHKTQLLSRAYELQDLQKK